MADLHLDNVKKRYGALDILHGVDLAVEDGEFVVLVGPSGCGKSTLLRMIAGLETVSVGEIRIGGRRANEVPPQKRNISMVFQSYALFPHMTVKDNITFGPRIRRENAQETEEKLKRAASILNLGAYLDRRASFPAASASVSPWGAPLSAILISSCSMSLSPTSMRNSGCRCGRRSRRCTTSSKARSFT